MTRKIKEFQLREQDTRFDDFVEYDYGRLIYSADDYEKIIDRLKYILVTIDGFSEEIADSVVEGCFRNKTNIFVRDNGFEDWRNYSLMVVYDD